MTYPFERSQAQREETLLPRLVALTEHHRERCEPYAAILRAIGHSTSTDYQSVAELPWLPVRLFKLLQLSSVRPEDVFRVLTSSGTTGEASRIYVDRAAAAAQAKALADTMKAVLGPDRLPMLIVDGQGLFKNRHSFSARGAGVLGMMNFGRDHAWVLDAEGHPQPNEIKDFLARHGNSPFLVFGFTFMVWRFLYEIARAESLDLSNGSLIHSGGWKRMTEIAVDKAEFRERFRRDTGLTRIHDFYGMVEQIGVVYLEGAEGGSYYCPDFADVVVRDPETWEVAPIGTPGVLQVISALPESYPGHVLLTEDLGVIHGIDDGTWPGKRFSVLGRLPKAEARGCSDTSDAGAPRVTN